MRPARLWRRSLSYQTGTCLAPETGNQRLHFILVQMQTDNEYRYILTPVVLFIKHHCCVYTYKGNANAVPIKRRLDNINKIIKHILRCHVMHSLTLMRIFSKFLHTSFLSVDIMSDFVISTRYLLKKSGYVHLEIPQHTLVNVCIPIFGWQKCVRFCSLIR